MGAQEGDGPDEDEGEPGLDEEAAGEDDPVHEPGLEEGGVGGVEGLVGGEDREEEGRDGAVGEGCQHVVTNEQPRTGVRQTRMAG